MAKIGGKDEHLRLAGGAGGWRQRRWSWELGVGGWGICCTGEGLEGSKGGSWGGGLQCFEGGKKGVSKDEQTKEKVTQGKSCADVRWYKAWGNQRRHSR